MNLPPTLPFKTVSELSQVKIAVSELSRVQYNNEGDFAEALAAACRANPVLSFIAEKLTSFEAIPSIQKEIAAFEANTPIAHVWSAYPLKAELIDRLGTAISLHFGETCLLDVQIDPQIVGGIACEVKGKYIDKSLRTITNDIINHYV